MLVWQQGTVHQGRPHHQWHQAPQGLGYLQCLDLPKRYRSLKLQWAPDLRTEDS